MPWLYGEPALDDMLSDPTINAVMERDKVDPDDLSMFLEDVRTSLCTSAAVDAQQEALQ